MVQTLLDTLPAAAPDLRLHQVNLPLSRDTTDIGRWRPGKLLVLARAIVAVWRIRQRHGPFTLYYVPAPGKRGALYRDIALQLCCRPLAERLILHWHACGLGKWLQRHAHPFERALARRALARADVSIVLGEALRADAALLHPLRLVVVRNGIDDPCPAWQPRPAARPVGEPLHVVFMGLCTVEKGVFAALAGVAEMHRRRPGSVRLTVAGEFPDALAAKEFGRLRADCGAPVDIAGFVTADSKHHLLAGADVFLFPTCYPHEAHPLVLLEALAHDLPVIVTDWRAVAEDLPPRHTQILDARERTATAIADALENVASHPRPNGHVRRYFLQHYTREHFAAAFAAALG